RPDVLLLGGDFVSVRGADIARLEPLLARIEAPLGKFAVLGNHDLRANYGVIEAALERAGVRLIINERVTLAAPFDDVTICGLDDPTYGEPRPELSLDGATGTRVVLMHSPEALTAIGNRAFDLALCGHTHGGQVAMPWGTPVLVPGGPLNRQYCRGRFELEGERCRTLLVSRGVGCSGLPARLFAAPEVHLCLII
ncbi:MAG TPA: metallophosphoesterase, partial [Gemmatimonadaceae bacterium]